MLELLFLKSRGMLRPKADRGNQHPGSDVISPVFIPQSSD